MNDKFNLINFGYNPWSTYWKRNQTIFYMLSKESFIEKSFFINSTVWLGNLLTQPKKELAVPKLNNWKAVAGTTLEKDKIKIITPVALPFERRFRTLGGIKDAIYDRYLDCNSGGNVLLIINNPSGCTIEMIKRCAARSQFIIFDWSDDFEQFEEDAEKKALLIGNIEEFIKMANLVICVNDKLTERAKRINNNAYTVKNATNYFNFNNTNQSSGTRRRVIPHEAPVIGYMGWINEARLDCSLIEHAASAMPEWNFVFIGPRSHERALESLSEKYMNVHLLEPVPYDLLPRVLEQFDVCILPNKINDHTDGNDPIKIYDYLACGKPIVTTRTAGVEQFESMVNIANNSGEFLEMIKKCLLQDDDKAQRVKTGYENSWNVRFDELKGVICESLEHVR